MLFSDLDIIKPNLNALDKQGYKKPTQTGTGKTAAFAIPILQLLSREKEISNFSGAIKCLILTPTRELAIQIEENIKQY